MSSGGRPGGAEFIGATLLFSLLLHGVLILGIGFRYAKPHPSMPTLDVTLVDVANHEAPRQADVLAQANNRGGGDRAEAARPSQRYAGELPRPSEDTAPQTATAAAPAPRQPTEQRLLTSIADSRFDVASATGRPPQEVTADADEARRQQAMAQLAAELRERNQAYAKRPKKKFISANTKEFAYAAYMRGWVDRVEQVGNLNYPDEARRRELHGQLELTVGINRDGSISQVEVIRSSGQPVLDQAAERIVRLAAPFPPLPPDRSRVDQLYITRTWQFLPGNVLRDQ